VVRGRGGVHRRGVAELAHVARHAVQLERDNTFRLDARHLREGFGNFRCRQFSLRVTISDVAKLAHFARHAVQLERHHPLRLDARHLRFVLLMTECLDVGV